MAFNVKKCMVMHFEYRNQRNPYYMMREELLTTTEEWDFGVLVCNYLKPTAHCAKAAKTAVTVLGQLNQAFHFSDHFIFIRLYKKYILPHLEFASQAWNPWRAKDKEVLQKVQRKAIGMVSGLKSTNYEERLRELDMITLKEGRHQSDMLQTYKILQKRDRVEASQWFKLAGESENRTHQETGLPNLAKPNARLEHQANFSRSEYRITAMRSQTILKWCGILSNAKIYTKSTGVVLGEFEETSVGIQKHFMGAEIPGFGLPNWFIGLTMSCFFRDGIVN